MAKYSCSICNKGLENPELNTVVSCDRHPDADYTAEAHLDLQDVESIIIEAHEDARLFNDEFPGEILDPAKTDWDAEGWANSKSRRLIDDADQSLGWELYQKELVDEIERLIK